MKANNEDLSFVYRCNVCGVTEKHDSGVLCSAPQHCGVRMMFQYVEILSDEERRVRYLAEPGKCPYCESDDIEGEPSASRTHLPIVCKACGRRWTDINGLVDVEFHEHP